MTRKPPSKLSRLDQLVKSHKHLLRAFRSLTQSNTELRKVVLEMRQMREEEVIRHHNPMKAEEEFKRKYCAYLAAMNAAKLQPPNDWPRL